MSYYGLIFYFTVYSASFQRGFVQLAQITKKAHKKTCLKKILEKVLFRVPAFNCDYHAPFAMINSVIF